MTERNGFERVKTYVLGQLTGLGVARITTAEQETGQLAAHYNPVFMRDFAKRNPTRKRETGRLLYRIVF